MKTKNKIKVLGLSILSATAVTALVGCGGATSDPTLHTYNTYLSTNPTNWNVHNWETNDESYITSFTEMGLYDCVLDGAKTGYEFVHEMASDFPTSIDPSELEDSDRISEDYYGGIIPNEKGYIWDIPLNRNAKFDNGTPINADTYVDSMALLLDPEYANYRADSYYKGNFVVCNAEKYYKNNRYILEPAFDYLTVKNDGSLTDSKGQKVDTNKQWFINFASNSTYAAKAVYGGTSTETVTFYKLLNQIDQIVSSDNTAAKFAAKRIMIGVGYYYLHYVNHDNEETHNKDKWQEYLEKDKPGNISEEMYNTQKPMDINNFNDYDIKTCASIDDSAPTVSYSLNDFKDDLKTIVNSIARTGTKYANKSWTWEIPLETYIYHAGETGLTFKNVGIEKIDDYKIRLYLEKPIAELDLKFQLCSNWIVDVALYKKLTKEAGTGKLTTYATNRKENYASYGPYRLSAMTSGTSITMEKNPNWYGWTDGEHEGQYQMDRIYTRIIPTHSTAVKEFEAGNLDDIDLTKEDMKTYGGSGRLTTTYESYTQKITFNTDRAKLAIRTAASGINKTILANYNFRKGLSLGIDRNSFASQTTAGSKAFTGLLNDLYISNVNTGEMYRNTTQGKSVYGLTYNELGGKPTDATRTPLELTQAGYNYAWAKYYVQQGIKEEIDSTKDKHLKKGDKIEIEFRVYDNESDTTKNMKDFLEKAWGKLIQDAIADMTSDEQGKYSISGIGITLRKDEDYYTSARNGNFDMIFSIWGGAAIDPYGLMQVYLDKTFTNNCEYGFKGKQGDEKLTINYGGVPTEKSYDEWYHVMNDELNEGKYSDTVKGAKTDAEKETPEYKEWNEVHQKRLDVLAGTEAGIINRFEAIPMVARGTSSLLGFKVENATNQYVNLIGYGGIRFLKFNYNDGEWSKLVSQYNGNLKDAYANAE